MRALVLTLLVTIGGCGIFGPTEPVGKASTPAEQAQLAVNEANLSLTAAANVVAGNLKDRVWTKAQAQGYLDKIKDLSHQVDRAQELIRLGDFTQGKTQAEVVKAALIILHREIAAKAREGK